MSENVDLMKEYVIQSKNGIIINFSVSEKELDDWRSCEKGYIWNPSRCDCECNKATKLDEYLDIKNCSCEKCLSGKLALECEDEILSTSDTLPNDKKVTYEKSNCFGDNIFW